MGQSVGIVKYFQWRHEKDDSYCFTVDLGKDVTLRSVFWVDGRARSVYTQFPDILVFVSLTRRKIQSVLCTIYQNKPSSSVSYRGAFSEDETAETFVWLFTRFHRCMFDRPPAAFIAYYSTAICKAIGLVYLESRHPYYM